MKSYLSTLASVLLAALPNFAQAQVGTLDFDCATQGGTNCVANLNRDTGLTSSFNVPSTCGELMDVNVRVDLQHTWVGDIQISLQKNLSNIRLLNASSNPDTGFGCSSDDVGALFDDSGSTPASTQCNFLYPAIQGTVSPAQSMGELVGQEGSGAWTLQITDFGELVTTSSSGSVGDDEVGRLRGWGLQLTCELRLTPTPTATPPGGGGTPTATGSFPHGTPTNTRTPGGPADTVPSGDSMTLPMLLLIGLALLLTSRRSAKQS